MYSQFHGFRNFTVFLRNATSYPHPLWPFSNVIQTYPRMFKPYLGRTHRRLTWSYSNDFCWNANYFSSPPHAYPVKEVGMSSHKQKTWSQNTFWNKISPPSLATAVAASFAPCVSANERTFALLNVSVAIFPLPRFKLTPLDGRHRKYLRKHEATWEG